MAARLLVAVLALCLLLPASGSARSGQKPASAAAPSAHATKKKKRRHKRCKRYRKVRVKRGHHYRTVRRCIHKKKHKKKTAATAPAPIAPTAPAGPPGFTVGMVSGPAPAWEAAQMPNLHPALVRFEVDINTSAASLASQIAGLAAHGSQALPMASFYGRIPTAAEVQNLASWAHAFGPGGTFWQGRADGYLAMRHIEFGNETNNSYQFSGCGPGCSTFTSRAQQYALRARDAALAINSPAGNPNVSLLAQGDSGGCWCSQWLDGMFSAVPNLNTLIGGWSVHPYGPKPRYGPSLDEMVRDTARHGDTTLPFYATEYGISTDNGRCLSDNYQWPTCLTYAQAATDLQGAIAEMHATYGTRLAAVMIYEQRDVSDSGSTSDREGFFGAYQHNFAPKGAYTTAVQGLLAAFRG